MSAKEKANELVDKFIYHVESYSCEQQEENAKACALITVDELIKAESNYFPNESNYWQQVKQEIELL